MCITVTKQPPPYNTSNNLLLQLTTSDIGPNNTTILTHISLQQKQPLSHSTLQHHCCKDYNMCVYVVMQYYKSI